MLKGGSRGCGGRGESVGGEVEGETKGRRRLVKERQQTVKEVRI